MHDLSLPTMDAIEKYELSSWRPRDYCSNTQHLPAPGLQGFRTGLEGCGNGTARFMCVGYGRRDSFARRIIGYGARIIFQKYFWSAPRAGRGTGPTYMDEERSTSSSSTPIG